MSGICHWFAVIHWGKIADWAVAMGTLALAGATFWVARAAVKTLEETRRLVDETHNLVMSNNKIIESEERHHQENLRPICIFELDPDPIGSIVTILQQSGSRIKGCIVNKGRGVAVEGEVYLVLPAPQAYLAIRFQAVGHNEFWYKMSYYDHSQNSTKTEYFIIPLLWCNEECARKVLEAFVNRDIVIFIRYTDIFGNFFITEQKMRKDTGQFDITLREGGSVPLDGLSCVNNPKNST